MTSAVLHELGEQLANARPPRNEPLREPLAGDEPAPGDCPGSAKAEPPRSDAFRDSPRRKLASSHAATLVCFRDRANSAATLPSESATVLEAPHSHKRRTHGSWPLAHANMSAVWPFRFVWSTRAPLSSSTRAHDSLPIVHVSIRAVTPAGLVWSTAASRLINSSAVNSWPLTQAYLSAVKPMPSTALTSAPASRSCCMRSVLPLRHALRIASCVLFMSSSFSSAHTSKRVEACQPRLLTNALLHRGSSTGF